MRHSMEMNDDNVFPGDYHEGKFMDEDSHIYAGNGLLIPAGPYLSC